MWNFANTESKDFKDAILIKFLASIVGGLTGMLMLP
jgi:hypothetical protein